MQPMVKLQKANMNDFTSSASSTVLFRCVANYCLIPTGCVKLIHTWKIIPTGVCQTVVPTWKIIPTGVCQTMIHTMEYLLGCVKL